MRDVTVARNYAEALYEIGERHKLHDDFVNSFVAFTAIAQAEPRLRAFLESPKIETAAKRKVLRIALAGRAPTLFLNFMMVLLQKRRQRLLLDIGREYRTLVDEKSGKLHAQVTLARQPEAEELQQIIAQLSRMLGKEVVPHLIVNREILGGVIVRYGDRVLDGSLRRRLVSLRNRLLDAGLPANQ